MREKRCLMRRRFISASSAPVILLALIFLILSGFTPSALPFIPGAPYSDAALSHWPAALHLRESVLEHGAFPEWRDGIMGAQPFAANPLNKTAYPLQWLALLLSPGLHIGVMVVLHGAIAGWGMWRWARAHGQSEAAAAVAALGYVLAPRLLAHTGAGHLDLLYALAWWPWLMWAVRPRRLTPSPSEREGTQANFTVHILRIALFAALLVLADVRLGLFALALAAASALADAWRGEDWRRLARLWPVVPLLLVLTASLWLPLLGWRPYLSRAELTLADAGVFSLAPGHLLGLLGFPVDGGNPELVTYGGLSMLILAVIALVRSPRRHALWLVALAVALLYALGIHSILWTALVQIVPALLWFRVPGRAWLVVALVLPLLAGFGVDTLLGSVTASARRRSRRLAVAALVAALAGASFLWLALPALRVTALAFLLGGVGVLGVAWLALARRVGPRVVAGLLLVVVFADLSASGLRWLSWRGSEAWLAPSEPVAAALVDDGARRVYAPYATLDDGQVTNALGQATAAAYGLSLFGGVDPFQLSGFVGAVAQASGVEASGYDVVQPPIQPVDRLASPDARILAEWGVTHIASPVALGAGWEPFAEVSGAYLYRVEMPPGALNAWGWPEGWPGLPDANTVRRLNGMTVGAWAFSTALLVGCAALLALLERRRARV